MDRYFSGTLPGTDKNYYILDEEVLLSSNQIFVVNQLSNSVPNYPLIFNLTTNQVNYEQALVYENTDVTPVDQRK